VKYTYKINPIKHQNDVYLENPFRKGHKMAKIIKRAETMFSRFERSLESLADKLL